MSLLSRRRSLMCNKFRVRFYDNLGNLLSTQYVEKYQSAIAPSNPVTNTNFCTYTFIGWDKDYSNITANVDVYALANINVLYLFRTGYGINNDYYDTENPLTFSICNKSPKNIASSYNNDAITCAITTNNAGNSNAYPSAGYISYLKFSSLDFARLSDLGVNEIVINGTYSFYSSVSGYDYIAVQTLNNVRCAFYGLFDNDTNTIQMAGNSSTQGVTNAKLVRQVALNSGGSGLTSTDGYNSTVPVSSGSLNAVINIANDGDAYPTTGEYYLAVGLGLYSTRVKATLTITNIFFR